MHKLSALSELPGEVGSNISVLWMKKLNLRELQWMSMSHRE